MTHLCIVYHSGSGHTEIIAKKVAEGVVASGCTADLHNVAELNDALWEHIAKADGLIFGSPTYMGSVSAPFKAFMDASSKQWFGQEWKDKIAAGFTNSSAASGDKLATLQTLANFSAQHSMVWVSQGVWPSAYSGDGKGLNRLGSWLGLMAQSANAAADATNPNAEDQGYAIAFGERVGKAAQRWVKGK